MDTVIRAVPLSGTRTALGPELPRVQANPGASTAAPLAAESAVPAPRDTQESAQVILERRIREELAAEAERVYAAQRQRAQEAGRQEGLRDAKQQIADELAKLQSALRQKFASLQTQIETAHREALDTLGARATDIAFVSVCRILGAKAVSRETMAELVQEQIGRFAADEIIAVRLHPRDLALLEDGSQPLVPMGNLRLLADDTVAMGGCLIDTRMGRYDARLDVQLTKLKQVFDQARCGAAHG